MEKYLFTDKYVIQLNFQWIEGETKYHFLVIPILDTEK